MKEFKPRDKLTQRMTRDGAVLDNQTTGEEIHISERDEEKQLSPNEQPVQMGKRYAPMTPAEDIPKHGRQLRPQEQKEPEKEQPKPQQPSAEPFQPQGGSPVSHIPQDIPTSAAPGGTAEKLFDRAAAEHDAHKARQTARMSRDAAQQRYSASRLQFSEEERAAPELRKHIHRAEKAADKLDAAQAAIPKKRVLRKERVFDEASGTAKTKLRFDTVDKFPPKLKPNPLGRPLREVAVQAHGKIHEVEHENVGVESGHKAEELAEHGAGGAIRWERRHRKLKPYRAAEKAEHKAVNANAEYHYQKVLHDNPEMLSGNPLNRFFQKQRLKREYAKAARTAKAAGSTAQATAKSAEKTAEATATAAKKAAEKAKEAAEFVAHHWKGVLVVLAGFLLIVLLIGGLQSCSALVGAAGGGVAASSYQSEDADILAAEAAYCALEAELQEYLDTYERTHDYDEYHYDLDEIKHDPYAVVLSGMESGKVKGSIYELDYAAKAELAIQTALRTDNNRLIYEKGSRELSKECRFEATPDREYGKFVCYEAVPHDPDALRDLLRDESRKRERLKPGNFKEHIGRLSDEKVLTEAQRLSAAFQSLQAPNSPNGTHFAVEVSPWFERIASSKEHERLFALLPYKTLYLSSVKDRHGVFAFISKDERRDLPLRKQRPSVRAQLKEGQSKKTAAPKKAAAKAKDNDLEV